MKIQSIAVSNIRSFRYDPDFKNEVIFNTSGLNLIIGPNGAGKSNLIEIMTRIFSSIYGADVTPYNDLRSLIAVDKRPTNYNAEPGIPGSLTKHRADLDKPSAVRLKILLDQTDLNNLQTIERNASILSQLHTTYYNDVEGTGHGTSIYGMLNSIPTEPTLYTIELSDTMTDGTRMKKMVEKEVNIAAAYLRAYRPIGTAIDIYNELLHPELFREYERNEAHSVNYQKTVDDLGISLDSRPIKRLEPTLLLMSVQDRIAQIDLGYARMVDISQSGVTARTRNFERQLMEKSAMGAMSNGSSESFEIVKEKIWYECFEKLSGSYTVDETIAEINNTSPILISLNEYLNWFDLKLELDQFSPGRSFIKLKLIEANHMADVVDLSSGQRTILNIASNLSLGAELKSFVLIDEIENHLHPSVQARLRDALLELSAKGSQAIAVTHSPVFVNAKTLEATARVYAIPEGSKVKMCREALDGDAKAVVNVLQYTNGARVFFTNRVLLVEGPSDEEFFTAYLNQHYPKADIEVIATGTKDQIENWKKIISSFDIKVYAISDLDSATKKSQTTITPVDNRSKTKDDFTPEIYKVLMAGAKNMRKNNRFILKEGALESYVPGSGDKIKRVREFINANQWDKLNHAEEIKEIVDAIISTT